MVILCLLLFACQKPVEFMAPESLDNLSTSDEQPIISIAEGTNYILYSLDSNNKITGKQIRFINITIEKSSWRLVLINWSGEIRRQNSQGEFEISDIEGRILFDGILNSSTGLLPQFWINGWSKSQSSGIWMGRDRFWDLSRNDLTNFKFDLRKDAPINFLEKYGSDLISTTEQGELTGNLVLQYPLIINGNLELIPTRRIKDSAGNIYYVVEDLRNPLIIKFEYNPFVLGQDPDKAAELRALLSYEIKEVFTTNN